MTSRNSSPIRANIRLWTATNSCSFPSGEVVVKRRLADTHGTRHIGQSHRVQAPFPEEVFRRIEDSFFSDMMLPLFHLLPTKGGQCSTTISYRPMTVR